MSEKEVRAKTRAYIERILSGVPPTSIATEDAELDLEQALSEPPDVVVLGRKLSEMQVIYEGKLANSKKSTYGLEEVAGRSYDKGVSDTVIGIGQLIEAVFHVRLTDDGWEYTDGTDN